MNWRLQAVSEYNETLLEMRMTNQAVKVWGVTSLLSKSSKPTASNNRSTGNRNDKDVEWANSDTQQTNCLTKPHQRKECNSFVILSLEDMNMLKRLHKVSLLFRI